MTTLDEALQAAHLPSLVVCKVRLTGDPSWLRPQRKPTYTPLSRGDAGLPAEEEAKIREAVKPVIEAWLAGDQKMPPPPPAEVVRKMMDFVAGAEIPEGYADFLMDELALSGTSSKDPQWNAPQLKSAARKLKVVIIGAGMSGLLAGIRMSQAGDEFTIQEKNPAVDGTWFEKSYLCCRKG